MDHAHARERLESRLEEMLRRTGAVEGHLRGDDGRNDADFSDRATITQLDDVLEELDEVGRREAATIRAALDRLDAGTYGVCMRCGKPIAEARLDAIPETPFCAADAAAMEAG